MDIEPMKVTHVVHRHPCNKPQPEQDFKLECDVAAAKEGWVGAHVCYGPCETGDDVQLTAWVVTVDGFRVLPDLDPEDKTAKRPRDDSMSEWSCTFGKVGEKAKLA